MNTRIILGALIGMIAVLLCGAGKKHAHRTGIVHLNSAVYQSAYTTSGIRNN